VCQIANGAAAAFYALRTVARGAGERRGVAAHDTVSRAWSLRDEHSLRSLRNDRDGRARRDPRPDCNRSTHRRPERDVRGTSLETALLNRTGAIPETTADKEVLR
jgi:hypothetical protein